MTTLRKMEAMAEMTDCFYWKQDGVWHIDKITFEIDVDKIRAFVGDQPTEWRTVYNGVDIWEFLANYLS